MDFSGACSPVRLERKRFPDQICMAHLKTPNKHNNQNECYDILLIEEEQEQLEEAENLRLHHQRSWLSIHNADKTILSLRAMTDYQRKSFRALFDILDEKNEGKICLTQLRDLLQDIGAKITLGTLRTLCHETYQTKYPTLTFVQFCELLLRDDIRVKLKNSSMDKVNRMRLQRAKCIKNMQYFKDAPTESQKRIIQLRIQLDELKAHHDSKHNLNTMEHSENQNSYDDLAIPISVFIQSWARRQLLKELETQSYLSKSTLRRTKKYVAKSTTNKQPLRVRTKSILDTDECTSRQHMLLKSLDSAMEHEEEIKSGKQAFSFDNVPRESQRFPRKLQKSYSASVLHPKHFDLDETKSFDNAVKIAVKDLDNSLLEDFPMYSLKKHEDAMKFEVHSTYNTLPPSNLECCFGSPSFEGVRKTSKKTPAERDMLKRNATLPKLLLH